MWEIFLDISKQLGKLINYFLSKSQGSIWTKVSWMSNITATATGDILQKGILKNFAKLQKSTCVGVSKVANLSSSLKNRLWNRCFPVKFERF